MTPHINHGSNGHTSPQQNISHQCDIHNLCRLVPETVEQRLSYCPSLLSLSSSAGLASGSQQLWRVHLCQTV
ncbi:hypothetical protein HBI18_073130 [Parastagonospora nodorum]|nr:hypothetical protein HBI18_073130 [Parastagonospora nodorum]KAH5798714.1 hypothetical protein HBI96_160500 [Parastagonospora nodorum]